MLILQAGNAKLIQKGIAHLGLKTKQYGQLAENLRQPMKGDRAYDTWQMFFEATMQVVL